MKMTLTVAWRVYTMWWLALWMDQKQRSGKVKFRSGKGMAYKSSRYIFDLFGIRTIVIVKVAKHVKHCMSEQYSLNIQMTGTRSCSQLHLYNCVSICTQTLGFILRAILAVFSKAYSVPLYRSRSSANFWHFRLLACTPRQEQTLQSVRISDTVLRYYDKVLIPQGQDVPANSSPHPWTPGL